MYFLRQGSSLEQDFNNLKSPYTIFRAVLVYMIYF